MDDIVDWLITNNKTISVMESCTGGYIASSITNVSDSSKVFEYGAVTYSNEFKIKMGVDFDIINRCSVYSIECAMEMSKKITMFANSDYGIGVTGKLNKCDINNKFSDDDKVYISIYDKNNDKFYNNEFRVHESNRLKNKELVLNEFILLFDNCIKK